MLAKDVEECVKGVQEYVDTESAQWMSTFGSKTISNEAWLDEINESFQVMNNDTLDRLQELKLRQMGQLTEIESQIETMEKLCDELEEIHDEIEVKVRLNQQRRE